MGDHTANGGVDPADDEPVEGPELEVAPALPARVRPLANLAVVVAGLLTVLVLNGRSTIGDGQALRTSDASTYVEPVLRTTTTLGAPPSVGGDGAQSGPAEPTSSPATSTTTVEAPTTVVTEPAADASVTTADPAQAAAVPPPAEAPPGDVEGVSRAIPEESAEVAPAVVSPWQADSRLDGAGHVATKVGCASGTSASALDAFFRERVGPVLGLDYQHVYPLGGGRYLWLFQDAFVDYSGLATNLAHAAFIHNIAMVQDGSCFTLLHQGSIARPTAFEPGNGGNPVAKWFWPMGGQTFGGTTYVYWAQMERDGYDPKGADGLGWHPVLTWIAAYDSSSLARLSFRPATNPSVTPIYGYAVDSDDEYTYLFGNSFEQNLAREGGYFNGPHSGTSMYLARVPLASFGNQPEYWADGTWVADAGQATPISHRYWAENPMQPRRINGQWVSATKLDGYWGDELVIDVANDPWGPWTTVEQRYLAPRGGDPLMNTYQAHLMPWLAGGSLVVSASNNARNMYRDAWPRPDRYRPTFFGAALVAPPPAEDTTTSVEESTTVPESTTTVESTTTTSTTVPPVGSSSSVPDSTSTTSTSAPPESSSTTTTTTTTSAPPPSSDPPSSSSSTTTTLPDCDPEESTTTTSTDPPQPPDCVPVDESTTSSSEPSP